MSYYDSHIQVWRSGTLVAVYYQHQWFNVEDEYFSRLLNEEIVLFAGQVTDGRPDTRDTWSQRPLRIAPIGVALEFLQAKGYEVRWIERAPTTVLVGEVEAGERLGERFRDLPGLEGEADLEVGGLPDDPDAS